MRNGVADDAISIIPDEVEAVDAGLEMAEAGDLLVIFGDDSPRCWKQIIYHSAGVHDVEAVAQSAKPGVGVDFEEMFDTDQSLIRDERGVRLAREIDENAD